MNVRLTTVDSREGSSPRLIVNDHISFVVYFAGWIRGAKQFWANPHISLPNGRQN